MANESVIPSPYTAALVLSSGEVFFGFGVGDSGTTYGEICFNTAMTGYQEILTDPSYDGQIITFTFPHIGNVGCNEEDVESRQAFAKGLIIGEPITKPSNFRSKWHLNDWLIENNLTGISGVDTRKLTRHIRLNGPQNVAIAFPKKAEGFDLEEVKAKLKEWPELEGLELAKDVSTTRNYEWKQQRWTLEKKYEDAPHTTHHVVAIDYGEKLNILRSLASRNCKITVVPADTSAADILALKPDGIFLSNGPGDPAATADYAVPVIRDLLQSGKPIFGICLGHQLLATALGAKTEKMNQGNRGANHPIKNEETGKVEITSQNHGFVVSYSSLPDALEVTHVSLFDGTIAGIKLKNKPVFGIQYHPESSPGPHDSQYLFDQFVEMMEHHAEAN